MVTPPSLLAVEAFVIGAAIGSFLNVVALRYLQGQSFISGRSRCPHCRRALRWFELVPLVSYCVQFGRCIRCRQAISPRYVLVELLSGILTAVIITQTAAGYFTGPQGIALLLLAYILVILALIDFDAMLLPDMFIAAATLAAVAAALYARRPLTLAETVIGVAIGAGFLASLWLITRGRGIGLGDVKLMVPLGIVFGPWGTLAVLMLAFSAGGLLGIVLLAAKKATPKTAVPFGPFLIGAALLLIASPHLTNAARALLMLQ